MKTTLQSNVGSSVPPFEYQDLCCAFQAQSAHEGLPADINGGKRPVCAAGVTILFQQSA